MPTNYWSWIIPAVLALLVLGGALAWWSMPTAVTPVPITQNPATTTTQTYLNPALHYSITYPDSFTVSTVYSYKALGPDVAISGVSFTIPASTVVGTNLSPDSYISIESLASSTCSGQIFLGDAVATATDNFTDSGVSYSFAKGGDAAAGNFYEEYVYALKGHTPCIAVRYFIHSANINNYPAGTVRAFNHAQLLTQFDAIRHSLTFTK